MNTPMTAAKVFQRTGTAGLVCVRTPCGVQATYIAYATRFKLGGNGASSPKMRRRDPSTFDPRSPGVACLDGVVATTDSTQKLPEVPYVRTGTGGFELLIVASRQSRKKPDWMDKNLKESTPTYSSYVGKGLFSGAKQT